MEVVLGNRGKCAQVCRLPYELIENSNNDKVIDKGYLLSPRDLCSLDLLPELINLGINSFKIEGRMKSPDYVATVTRIYRKYIDLALRSSTYNVSDNDRKELLQVFNRGGFSSGHLNQDENKNLIFPEKPNNMGIYLGNISNFNKEKGYITVQLNETISIGDTLSVEGEDGKYTVSELLKNNQNIKLGNVKDTVKLGRIKGNIKIGAKVYKLSSKQICDEAKNTYLENVNLKKIPINIHIDIKENLPIKVKIAVNVEPFYSQKHIEYTSDIIPTAAINSPISEEAVINQFSKLGNTAYSIQNISTHIDNNLYVNIKDLNEIRRNAINLLEDSVITKRAPSQELIKINNLKYNTPLSSRNISVLLENINLEYDYSSLNGFDNVYIPLKYFVNKKYSEILTILSSNFNMFIYMPTIIKANYKNLLLNNLDEIVKSFQIKGFVISNISGLKFLEKYISDEKYKIVANYTMNIFNSYTINELKNIGITDITPSVELNKFALEAVINNTCLPIELIVYGRMILMNSAYCLLGKTNKCYPECEQRCSNNKKYYLRDRLGFRFRIIPDKLQTVTSIYNSKINSIDTTDFNVKSIRINILDETINQINNIVATAKLGKKLEGSEYTNGNLNREI